MTSRFQEILLLFLYSSAIAKEFILEVVRGSNATLPCKLNGTSQLPEWSGPPDFTIYSKPTMHDIDNSVALSAIEHRLSRSKNDLVIRDVKKEDEGIYQCSYDFNNYRFKLVVIDTACGSGFQAELRYVRGSVVIIPCNLNGTFHLPDWKGPSNLTISASEGQIFATTIGVPSAIEHRLYRSTNDLVIINVTKEDEGIYQCSYNISSCRFRLVVTDPANADTGHSQPIATCVVAVPLLWIILCTFGIYWFRTHQDKCFSGSLKKLQTWTLIVFCYLFIGWFFMILKKCKKDSQEGIELKLGDKVKVLKECIKTNPDVFETDVGRNENMNLYINQVGTIVDLLGNNMCCVQYPDAFKMDIRRGALHLSHRFAIGEKVSILNDVKALRKLHSSHSAWNAGMQSTPGKSGKIAEITPAGNITVKIDDYSWTFNPMCCSVVPADDEVMENKCENELEANKKPTSVNDEEEPLTGASNNNPSSSFQKYTIYSKIYNLAELDPDKIPDPFNVLLADMTKHGARKITLTRNKTDPKIITSRICKKGKKVAVEASQK